MITLSNCLELGIVCTIQTTQNEHNYCKNSPIGMLLDTHNDSKRSLIILKSDYIKMTVMYVLDSYNIMRLNDCNDFEGIYDNRVERIIINDKSIVVVYHGQNSERYIMHGHIIDEPTLEERLNG